MTLHPVIRLRDARHFDRPFNSKTINQNAVVHVGSNGDSNVSSNGIGNGNHANNGRTVNSSGNGNGNGNGNGRQARIEKRIDNTCRRLMAIPGHVNKGEMRSSLDSMQSLIEHYFSFKSNSRRNPRKQRMAYCILLVLMIRVFISSSKKRKTNKLAYYSWGY